MLIYAEMRGTYGCCLCPSTGPLTLVHFLHGTIELQVFRIEPWEAWQVESNVGRKTHCASSNMSSHFAEMQLHVIL